MELCIKAKMHDYQVLAEPGALSRLGAYLCALRPLRWAVVADEAVAALYVGQEGGGPLHERYPPQEGGRGKARQIPHHAAA